MTRQELIQAVIDLSVDLEDGETGTDKCIEMFCEQLAIDAAAEAFKQGALEAGIPLAVIEGRAKLPKNPNKCCEPDIPICSDCREHAGFERTEDGDCVSECCGASAINPDPDIDMER